MSESAEFIRRSATDWKALIAAAALVSSAGYFAGGLYRESLLSDVRDLIDDHAKAAAGNRTQFLKEIESDARNAIGRIHQLERHCDIVQEWIKRNDSRLDELDRWRGSCSNKMAKVESQIERDLVDMAKIGDRLDRVEGLVSKGRRE
jgi:hypothetical protein